MLSWRQRATLGAHVFKAVCKQHHSDLLPLLRDVMPPDAIIVDVGAHAGQFTKLFSRLAPRGHVFAFEPGNYARLILSTVVRLHWRTNVTIVPAALGARAGTLILHLPLKPSGSLGFGLASLSEDQADARPVWTETVEVMTLDDFVARQGLARVDFIKADIEGWEMHMLYGAAETIRKYRPAVMLEIVPSHLQRAGNTSAEVWDFFASQGYSARPVNNGRLGPAAADCQRDGDYLFVAAGA